MSAVLQNVYAQLGGEEQYPIPASSESELDTMIRDGFSISVLRELRNKWNLTVMDLSNSLAIPKSTLMRMMEKQGRMSAADSDRVYRLARLLALAEYYIGERSLAMTWLRAPNLALGNQTPLRTLETEIGARRVEDVLGRIAYGGVS